MTGIRFALVGDPDWAGAVNARRALLALAPQAQIHHLPTGGVPTQDLDGVWLLPPPVGSDPTSHDLTISWALHLGIPLVGPLGRGEGGAPLVRAVPGSSLAARLGTLPLELPAQASGARDGAEYLAPAGTIWFAQAHRDGVPAVVSAGGAPFATLVDHPLATDAGVHPLLPAFASAAREHAAGRQDTPWTSGPPVRHRSSFAALPDDESRSYVHQMRTRGYRWWRPLLAMALGIGVFIFEMLVLTIAWMVLDPAMRDPNLTVSEIDLTAPVTMLVGNLMLIALIPAALVATRLGHWRPMGKLLSVTGRIRWRWMGRASLVTGVIWGAYIVLGWLLEGGEVGDRPEHWPWLIVITVLTTPLQAAAEEIAFRGGLLQGVGAWIKRPVVALVVGTVLSTVFFSLAHGSLDPWVLMQLGSMAVATCYLTWRTGGLEAAIVLHTVNNVVIILLLTLVGGLQGAYITESSTGDAAAGGIGGLATLLMMVILLWQARRAGIAPKKIGAPATG
ncbi:CPBP family intramembrane glutamic endopeptidase [Janibacter cremeus]|uniref:Membrane protease YdiL (CAAX protease family) n=1 Tax=Janibacter cremeus TaxID=1285192 RepID=A0A852VKI4_9MICO|nr:CPBP family intramembrane glutamic endopeptidase [Janibacter cremeus]NYF97607.1 membrane protease YdiL (CAAX protease family) [Janibacter cremeus]